MASHDTGIDKYIDQYRSNLFPENGGIRMETFIGNTISVPDYSSRTNATDANSVFNYSAILNKKVYSSSDTNSSLWKNNV